MISKAIVRPIARAIARAINGGRAFTWTLGYNGVDTVGQINAWQPTGNDWEIHDTFYLSSTDGMLIGNSLDVTTFIFALGDGTFRIRIDGVNVESASGVMQDGGYYVAVIKYISGTMTVKINGIEVINSVVALSVPSFDLFGKYFGGVFLDGQKHLTEFVDPLSALNSIRIDNRIQSATPPTDFAIYNTLKPALGSNVYDFANVGTVEDVEITEEATGFSAVSTIDNQDRVFINFPTVIGSEYSVVTTRDTLSGVGALTMFVRAGVDGNGDVLTSTSDSVIDLTFIATTGTSNLLFDTASSPAPVVYSFSGIKVKETNIIGTYSNGTYEPLLQGGGSAFDPGGFGSNVTGKSQQFSGNRNEGTFVNGVSLSTFVLSALSEISAFGSWHNDSIATFPPNSICVSENGAVLKGVGTGSQSFSYVGGILLGTDEQIQAGFEYPNVFRVLQDIGGTDSRDEWFFYDNGLLNQNGQPYPWQGAVFGPELWNGAVATASGESTWDEPSGVAHLFSTGATCFVEVDAVMTVGKNYVMTGEVFDYISGGAGFGDATQAGASIPQEDGIFEVVMLAGAANAQIKRTSACDLKIRNVSVKEIL